MIDRRKRDACGDEVRSVSPSDRAPNGLKIPAESATKDLQLMDRIVLGDMGPPTTGADARSELPTDPTALSGASVGRTSVATRIS
jgi:hypothetical protein